METIIKFFFLEFEKVQVCLKWKYVVALLFFTVTFNQLNASLLNKKEMIPENLTCLPFELLNMLLIQTEITF